MKKGEEDREVMGHVGIGSSWLLLSELKFCVKEQVVWLMFITSIEMIMSVVLYFISMVYYIDCMFNQPCIPGINPLLVMV